MGSPQSENKPVSPETLRAEEERLNAERAAFALEQKRVADLKAQGLNPDGSPIRPEYESLLDPETGKLKSAYQLNAGTIDPSKLEGYQAFRERALGQGPSEWAKLMLSQQELERLDAIDKATASQSGAQAQARSSLASKRGLTVGSGERLAAQGMKDLLAARQGIARQAASGKLSVLTADEDTKNKFLQQLPGMETDLEKYNIGNKAKSDEYNITRALEEKRAKDAQDLAVYQEQQKKWAAEKQADATAKSGGGGGGK